MASQIHEDVHYTPLKLLKFSNSQRELRALEWASKITVDILRYNRFEHHHSKHQLNPAMISNDHCTCFTTNIEKLNMLTHPQPILDIVMVITRKIATICKQ